MSASARSRSTNGFIDLGDRDAPEEVFSSPTKVGPMSSVLVAELLRRSAASEEKPVARAPESRVVPKLPRRDAPTTAPGPASAPPSLWFADDEPALEKTVVHVGAPPSGSPPTRRSTGPLPPPMAGSASRNAVPPPALPQAAHAPLPVERYLMIASPPAPAPVIHVAPLLPPSPPLAVAVPPAPAPVQRRDPWILFGIVACAIALVTLAPALYFLLGT